MGVRENLQLVLQLARGQQQETSDPRLIDLKRSLDIEKLGGDIQRSAEQQQGRAGFYSKLEDAATQRAMFDDPAYDYGGGYDELAVNMRNEARRAMGAGYIDREEFNDIYTRWQPRWLGVAPEDRTDLSIDLVNKGFMSESALTPEQRKLRLSQIRNDAETKRVLYPLDPEEAAAVDREQNLAAVNTQSQTLTGLRDIDNQKWADDVLAQGGDMESLLRVPEARRGAVADILGMTEQYKSYQAGVAEKSTIGLTPEEDRLHDNYSNYYQRLSQRFDPKSSPYWTTVSSKELTKGEYATDPKVLRKNYPGWEDMSDEDRKAILDRNKRLLLLSRPAPNTLMSIVAVMEGRDIDDLAEATLHYIPRDAGAAALLEKTQQEMATTEQQMAQIQARGFERAGLSTTGPTLPESAQGGAPRGELPPDPQAAMPTGGLPDEETEPAIVPFENEGPWQVAALMAQDLQSDDVRFGTPEEKKQQYIEDLTNPEMVETFKAQWSLTDEDIQKMLMFVRGEISEQKMLELLRGSRATSSE